MMPGGGRDGGVEREERERGEREEEFFPPSLSADDDAFLLLRSSIFSPSFWSTLGPFSLLLSSAAQKQKAEIALSGQK
jgi:hypothetical protein